jgi:hypothetical protein
MRAIGNTVEDCHGIGLANSSYETGAWTSYNSVTGCRTGISGDASNESGNGRYGHNVVTGNDVTGLSVIDGSAIVARNTAHENGNTGIGVFTAGTRIQNNTANDNGNYGINADPGVVDGGGNTATGNGTANCVNVSCP